MLQPEPGVVDLAEARRIVGGGAGLVRAGADGVAVMRLLADVGAALGASAGATRVVTDAGWMSYDRQIGTTGVSVNPELYSRSASPGPRSTSAGSARRSMWSA